MTVIDCFNKRSHRLCDGEPYACQPGRRRARHGGPKPSLGCRLHFQFRPRTQYTSTEFGATLAALNMRQSLAEGHRQVLIISERVEECATPVVLDCGQRHTPFGVPMYGVPAVRVSHMMASPTDVDVIANVDIAYEPYSNCASEKFGALLRTEERTETTQHLCSHWAVTQLHSPSNWAA
jgi:hypothetical protein